MSGLRLHELRERLGRAIATEGYTSPEEAFEDGISRQYCLDYADAMLKTLSADDLLFLLSLRLGVKRVTVTC
jgi:hypothetical protein